MRETTNTPEPSAATARSTQSEMRADLLELGGKSLSATFRVQLRGLGGVVTWYQDEHRRLRLDRKDLGPDGVRRDRTYVENGSISFSCREPGICQQGTEFFDYGSDQAELEGLGSLLVLGFQTFGQRAVDAQLARRTERVADVFGECFTFAQADDYQAEVCFDELGTPLRLMFTDLEAGAVGLKFEAIQVDHSIAATDFDPPYSLQH